MQGSLSLRPSSISFSPKAYWLKLKYRLWSDGMGAVCVRVRERVCIHASMCVFVYLPASTLKETYSLSRYIELFLCPSTEYSFIPCPKQVPNSNSTRVKYISMDYVLLRTPVASLEVGGVGCEMSIVLFTIA